MSKQTTRSTVGEAAIAVAVTVAVMVAVCAVMVVALRALGVEGPADAPVPAIDEGGRSALEPAEVETSSTTLEPEVATSSATLEYGTLEHVHEAYDLHLAAHAAAYAAWEADPNGEDYRQLADVLALRTAEYRAALEAWESGR